MSLVSTIALSFLIALAVGVLQFTRLARRHPRFLTRSFCLSMIVFVMLLTAGILGSRPTLE